MDGAPDVRVDLPPLGDGGRQCAVVARRDDEVGGLAGHVGGAAANRDSDVGGLERRRVVDAVARHRDDMTGLPESADDREFVLGRDSREHRRVAQVLPSVLADELGELGGIDAEIAPTRDLELPRHGDCGSFLVARDHDRADPRAAQLRDGFANAGAGRIIEARQANPDEIAFRGLRLRPGLEAPEGKGEDAVAALSDLVGACQQARPLIRAERPLAPRVEHPGAKRQEGLG